jgi:hypothetical protein
MQSTTQRRWDRWLVLLLFVPLLGCISKSKSRSQIEAAYAHGQQSVWAEPQSAQPLVYFGGDVRNQRIPWSEGLTLAQALLAAEYTWTWDPRVITVTRGNEVVAVDPKRLLRGQEDPLLEPGDRVEVRH